MSKNILDKNLYIDRENLEKIIEPSLRNYNNHIVDLILSVHNNESEILDYAKHNENLIITPHIAGLTIDSERKAQLGALTSLIDYFKTE